MENIVRRIVQSAENSTPVCFADDMAQQTLNTFWYTQRKLHFHECLIDYKGDICPEHQKKLKWPY